MKNLLLILSIFYPQKLELNKSTGYYFRKRIFHRGYQILKINIITHIDNTQEIVFEHLKDCNRKELLTFINNKSMILPNRPKKYNTVK